MSSPIHAPPLVVAIALFDDVEVLDFAGPYEVFTTASRVHRRQAPDVPPPFQVVTVAKAQASVRARAGLVVLPDHDFETCPDIDLLLVPGGVVDEACRDAAFVDWIRQRAAAARITASVCTGAFLLAQAGLLQGRRVTTHWEDIADLRRLHPGLQVHEDLRWVDEGSIVTSAGIAAGIDMSLHLVARLAGAALARATARQMDVSHAPAP